MALSGLLLSLCCVLCPQLLSVPWPVLCHTDYEKLGLYHIHNVALGTPRALGQASTAAVAAHHARLQHCMRWLCSTVESLAARDFGWSNRVSEVSPWW